MSISVKNYTNRYLAVVILVVIAIWAILFYAFMMDEVYDNIDDGLKNQKLEIIRAVYEDSSLLETKEFGINQFQITLTEMRDEIDKNEFSKEFIFMPYDEDDEPYRLLKTGFFTKDGKAYDLVIRTSTVEEDDYLVNLAISLSVLYVIIVLSVLIINHIVFSRAWKPFNTILSNLKNYRFGEVTTFDPVNTNVKEFEELNTNFELMIVRNEKGFVEQKRFIENASHELQTPLAITIQKLELLIADDSLTEEQVLKLVEAKQSLHRMANLNKSLLMLSRIDNDQYMQVEAVNCNQVVELILDELKEIIEHKNISLEYSSKDNFVAQVNSNLAAILFSNLIRNAIKYNIEGGQLIVEIDKDQISVSNSSNTEALNPDYIFERFYKGKQDNQSNGLGLSIVQSILKKYSFLSLTYSYEKDLHVFSLKK